MSDPSIDILTQRLAAADIDPQTRDALASDLDYASGIHADAEPAMLGVKRLVVSGVRRELLALAREAEIRADTRAAIEACRAAAAGPCVAPRRLSAFSVKWGEKSFDLAGPAAFVAVLLLGFLGFVWIRNSTKAEIRDTVHAVMSMSSVTASPWEVSEPMKETRQ